jgi:Ribbon-helix-helix protein, copG family
MQSSLFLARALQVAAHFRPIPAHCYGSSISLYFAPDRCNVVQKMIGEALAMAKPRLGRPSKARSTRASVSFPEDLYAILEQIANEKKVSIAWVIRDAAEKYVSNQWPLLQTDQ